VTAQHRTSHGEAAASLARWVRYILVGIVVVAVASAFLSFDTLDQLGKAVGYTAHWKLLWLVPFYGSWLLPVSVDALGFMATLAWLAPFARDVRRLACTIALIDMAASMVMNAAYHGAHAAHWIIGDCWGLIIGVGSIPPLALAVAVHLGAKVLDGAHRTSQAPAPVVEMAPTRAATNSGVGEDALLPAPVHAPSPLPGPAPVTTAPVTPEDAPLLPVECSAPVAPVTVPERSGESAPVPAPVVQTGAPEKPRPERRTGARSGGTRRPAAKTRSGGRAAVPSKDEKIRAAVDAIVAHHNSFQRKPSQRELKLALEFPPRNDDMPEVYRLADEALARRAVNG
jgi:hypothetical protein